jgi:hypothetical protein
MSGTGCPPADQVATNLAGTADPDAEGNWSVTARVPDNIPPQEQSATAVCWKRADHSTVFEYFPVSVTATTARKLRIGPSSSVRRGATLTVTPSAPCPATTPGGSVSLVLQTPDQGHYNVDPIVPGDGAYVNVGANGSWSARIHIAPSTTPGSYVLNAVCEWSRSYTAFYAYAPVTVS